MASYEEQLKLLQQSSKDVPLLTAPSEAPLDEMLHMSMEMDFEKNNVNTFAANASSKFVSSPEAMSAAERSLIANVAEGLSVCTWGERS